jgi:hypothetical protein
VDPRLLVCRAMSDEQRNDSGKFRGPSRAAPYALSRLSGPVSLVDAAREIERADQWIASTAGAQLEQIAEQMRVLREQAERVLQRARQDAALHRAEARFVRHPGKVYHLYEREDGQRYWSLLSPDDWRGVAPHPFVGSYRLELDQSWTPLAQTEARDRARAPLAGWLEHGLGREPALAGDILPSEPAEDTCENSSSPPSDRTVQD